METGQYEAVALGTALEQATLMAKQLPNANLDASQILQIYSSLHTAHHQLSLFLSQHPPSLVLQQQQQQRPSLFQTQPPAPENSFSSAVGGGGDDTDVDPMQVIDGDYEHDDGNEAEQKVIVDGVEERMRDCFIQNKRPKRSLSPSAVAAVAEQRRTYENEVAGRGCSSSEFDPQGTKLRSLDLIYQFHGWEMDSIVFNLYLLSETPKSGKLNNFRVPDLISFFCKILLVLKFLD